MDIHKLLSLITNSDREDWDYISGATFKNTFSLEETPSKSTLRTNTHYGTGVYIHDVSVTLQYGLTWHENYQAEWRHNFPDHSAQGQYLDVFYNSALVHRAAYISVDGHKLPAPNNVRDRKVTQGACNLIRVIDRMARAYRYHDFEDALKTAGFTVVDETWPSFTH